jgi:hypothetical protein
LNTPTPDFTAAADFLFNKAHPGRNVVVSGIAFDKQDRKKASLPTETFGPGERERFIAWASAAALEHNLYYSVGEPIKPVSKKMERTDIRAVHFLHVDVDPVKGRPIDEERARILALLRDPPGIPPPTCITFSGGGYQALWKLSEPIVIDGDLAKAEDAKLYNIHLENVLVGDNCHDVSRILRLPGSVNVPNKKKRENGQVEMLAEVIEWHDDRVYELAQFPKGTLAGSVPRKESKPTSAKVDRANVRRLGHVDQLGPGVGEKCKQCIVNGYIPDDPKGVAPGSLDHFPSRSERLLWVCCELVRASTDPEVIYAVITDPDFKISESITEKGNGAERYALRQIERATDEAIMPELRELNDKHFVIRNMGGKCRVLEWVKVPILGREYLSEQTFDDFRNGYMNRKVVVGRDKNGNDQEMPMGEWWLRHSHRRQFERVVFSPSGQGVSPDDYNVWRGLSAQPDGLPDPEQRCAKYLSHLREVICAGDDAKYQYLIGWMARCVQLPGEPGQVAVVLKSARQGTGKGTAIELFGELFGQHYLQVTHKSHVTGNFNDHTRDCVLMFADEALFAGNPEHANILKGLITEKFRLFEAKYRKPDPGANCVHLVMASNEEHVAPVDDGDRRYAIFEVSDAKAGEYEYFEALRAEWKAGGREAFLQLLWNYDLSNFNVFDRPVTREHGEQVRHGLKGAEAAFLHLLSVGEMRLGVVVEEGSMVFTTADFLEWAKTAEPKGANWGRITPNAVANLLHGPQANYKNPRHRPGMGFEKTTGRPRGWRIPPLSEARRIWDHMRPNCPGDWEDAQEGWSGVADYAGAKDDGGF